MELNDFLQYKNIHLVNRYKKDYPSNHLSAEEALSELMKYFWLSQRHHQQLTNNSSDETLNFSCVMHREMLEVDQMWHTFLLFTKDYTDFCMKYFGEYLHHSPNTQDGVPTGEEYEAELTRYLSYIYDNLGEETVRKWFRSILNVSA